MWRRRRLAQRAVRIASTVWLACIGVIGTTVTSAADGGGNLQGQIYDLRGLGGNDQPPPAFDMAAFIDALAAARYVILGEQHDNDAHHQWQAAIVAALAARRKPGVGGPAVVFEQIRQDQTGALQTLLSVKPAPGTGSRVSVEALKAALEWSKSGWSAVGYDPLFHVVLSRQLAIVPGDVSRDRLRRVARGGLTVLPATQRLRLGLSAPWPAALADDLERQIDAAHCGAMPKAAYAGMAAAQRLRDATLAEAMRRAAKDHGQSVLITGAIHSRLDRGVPFYLNAADAAVSAKRPSRGRLLSVWLTDQDDPAEPVTDLIPRDPAGQPAADFLIVTKAPKRTDPCLSFKTSPAKAPPRQAE